MALIEIDFNSGPIRDFLPILLTDRTTKKNIIFATDSYAHLGAECGAKCRITPDSAAAADIRPRVLKAADERTRRTRERAEVFTPAWVCRMMNDWCDEVWFGRKGVFDGSDPVEFPDGMNWWDYVNSQRLEITCGEAPYLVSRYDMNTGEVIPVGERAGILDRKLRVVGENTKGDDDWRRWALKAFQSVYGYEYQGDNLLIGRINLFMTYVEYTREIRTREPEEKELRKIANVISWNLWQMDGLSGTVPVGALYDPQLTLFEEDESEKIPCRIYDWRGTNRSVEYNSLKKGEKKREI